MKYSIVRSSGSGVWFGVVKDYKVADNARMTVEMTDARKVHYWTGAAATSGLALTGPDPDGDSRICAPVTVVVGDASEIIECSDEAVAAFEKIKPWTARD